MTSSTVLLWPLSVKLTRKYIQNCKDVLTLMRAEGLINDTVESDELKLTWTTRSTWQYSNAVKSLQDMEKIEGIATKKQSSSWTAKQLSPKF